MVEIVCTAPCTSPSELEGVLRSSGGVCNSIEKVASQRGHSVQVPSAEREQLKATAGGVIDKYFPLLNPIWGRVFFGGEVLFTADFI